PRDPPRLSCNDPVFVKQQTKTLLVWLGLIVAVLALANLFNTSQQVKSISYAKFVEQIDKEWATFDDTTLAVEVHPNHLDIRYELDGQTMEVVGPVNEALYEKLDTHQIDYKVEPEDDSSLLQFAVMWLPLVLMV